MVWCGVVTKTALGVVTKTAHITTLKVPNPLHRGPVRGRLVQLVIVSISYWGIARYRGSIDYRTYVRAGCLFAASDFAPTRVFGDDRFEFYFASGPER